MALGIIVRDGSNVARTVTAMVVRDGGNVARTITEAWVRDTNNVRRLVFNPSGSATLTVTVSPEGASGFSFGTGTATTDVPVVATPAGGTAPYTYSWSIESYTSLAGPPTADSPTAASTTFTQTGIDPDTTVSASVVAVVEDDNGVIAQSDPFTVYFSDVS